MFRRVDVGTIRTDYVDGLRGVAVLAVVLFHMLDGIAGPSSAPHLYNTGARGVDLFFVISGFCLSLRVFSPRSNGSIEKPAAFLISRLLRIAPAYFVAIGLFALLSLTPFGLPTVAATHNSVTSRLIEVGREALFFLPNPPLYNASFWSLGVEMRWYFYFPLLIQLFMFSKSAFGWLGFGLYAAYATAWSLADAGTLTSFMLGIFAASLTAQGLVINQRFALFVAFVALTIGVEKQSLDVRIDHGDILWQAACFFFLVAGSDGVFGRMLRFAPLRSIGIASYSIYLIHQPFLFWATSHGIPRPVGAVGAVAIGFAFWLAIEKPLSGPWRSRCEDRIVANVGRLWNISCRLRVEVGGVSRES